MEDGGIGADAEGQRQYGDRGERRASREHPQSVAEIAPGDIQREDAAGVAGVVLHLVEAAEIEAGAARGFFTRGAGLLIFFDLAIEVEAQFLVEFLFDAVAAEDGADSVEEIAQHGWSSKNVPRSGDAAR
ncbi:hypothetical protein SBA4_2150027 [Candidatus Sulfopaludibacter sp. SbA4]|nr:hypothetical protein SBA4_2150027 [Candidatus Sulfopaludibacter sp. SbA4]